MIRQNNNFNMFPEAFLQRIIHQYYINAPALLKALGEPSPVSIRLNPGKWSRIPENSEQVPWCPDGWYMKSRPSFTLDPLYHSGCFYPQEASGMFLEEVFRQVAGESDGIKVLDLCGAPGGKSTHLSSIIGNKGFLVANEVIRSRAVTLAQNITKWGTGNTIVTQNDPSAFSKLEGYFDVAVVDAPCSGEGMFRDPTPVKEWSPANAALCSERQKRILMEAWPSLKENGILIYSTCSFNPCENEENIKWLLEKKSGANIGLDISKFPGIVEINYEGIKGYGFFPDKVPGEGFFLAVVQKHDPVRGSLPGTLKKSDIIIQDDDISVAEKWIAGPVTNLFRHGNNIYNLAMKESDFLFLQQYLNTIKGGTLLFTKKKTDNIPSHELTLLQTIKKDAFPVYELNYGQAVSYLKKENIILQNNPGGWAILSFRGVNLGFVKSIGSRINNYFPVEWRIRMKVTSVSEKNLVNWT